MNVVPMTPISSVKVLRNVPFDNTYKDVRKFSNTSSQIAYFTGKEVMTFTGLKPIGLFDTIRLPRHAESFYDCNYIMFQNANFGNKWFYAFIKEIIFKNVNMTEIVFEIDVFQTWMFDYTIKPSMVIREHASTDTVGSNLVTENVDIGYYREEVAETTDFFDSYTAVLATSWKDSQGNLGGYRGGLFTGLEYVPALVDNPTQVQDLVNLLNDITVANQVDAITSIFMMPSEFFTNGANPVFRRFDARMEKSAIGQYVPRNKKLLTYPYNFLYVFTPDGANAIYRYEFFQSQIECGFNIQCAMSCNPEIILQPIAYQNQQFNKDESITMTGFPQCSYSIDSFKAYLAQNALPSIVGMGMSMATGDAIGTTSAINGLVQASQRPPMSRGSQGNSTYVGTREKNFYFVNKHISEEYARIIDSYFDVYGYATNRVKVPNISGRPSWNYVQTQDVKITGSIPFDDMAKIKSIFNNGVTFWHVDDVGNYSLNNQI